jgi:hypothetical protein
MKFSRIFTCAAIILVVQPIIPATPMPKPSTTQSALKADAGLGTFITQFQADSRDLEQLYPIKESPARRARFEKLYNDWSKRLDDLGFDSLTTSEKADALLLANNIERSRRQLALDAEDDPKRAQFAPFGAKLTELVESQVQMATINPETIAADLSSIAKSMPALEVELGKSKNLDKPAVEQSVQYVRRLRAALATWFKFYDGYDPMFSWWCEAPYKDLDKRLGDYAVFLREKLIGVKADDDNAIIGHPVGRAALMADLANERIPYTPEELIAAADKEFAWCEGEMKKASREMGYGDDWKKALEHVKTLHVEPGKQPELIKKLAFEAIDFVESRHLVTVPEMAKETLRMEMMSPERQLVNPFFLGGPLIIVSYPTSTMGQDEKLMSMRGNNEFFSRATVFHELIPGHHLQDWAQSRFRTYRRPFSSPFWTEGWAVYWEMTMWDQGFGKTPEQRIGMLFWRMHRCARVIFSLKFHLGEMTAQQCIDMLVDKVGHERSTAEGEVRRSFGGAYPPLYQLAYLIGAFEFRALHHEMVDSGKMTDMQFHDAILHENNVPVAVTRAILTGVVPKPGSKPDWHFLDEIPEEKSGG